MTEQELREALADTLDDLGFPDEAKGATDGESFATLERDIGWHEGHVGEPDTEHVYAAARAAIQHVAKQVRDLPHDDED